MHAKITTRLVSDLTPRDRPNEVWDTALSGFLLRVQPTGRISYYFDYRTAERRRRRYKLGTAGALTVRQARDLAEREAASSHSAPFFAVLKQFWQRLLKRGEDELYTDHCICSNLLFPWSVFLNHNFPQTARPTFLSLWREPQEFGFPTRRTPNDHPAPPCQGPEAMTDIAPVLCKARTSAWWLRVILSCVRCWSVANQRRRRW